MAVGERGRTSFLCGEWKKKSPTGGLCTGKKPLDGLTYQMRKATSPGNKFQGVQLTNGFEEVRG